MTDFENNFAICKLKLPKISVFYEHIHRYTPRHLKIFTYSFFKIINYSSLYTCTHGDIEIIYINFIM